MKKSNVLWILSVILAFIAFSVIHRSASNSDLKLNFSGRNSMGLSWETILRLKESREQGKQRGGFEKAMEYLHAIRSNDITGKVGIAEVIEARKKTNERAKSSSGSLELKWEELGPDNVGGRCRALLIDRNDPKKMFAGGVSGGLFVSDNSASNWSVHPDNAFFGNLGISCIAQSVQGQIYIGTGESFAHVAGTQNSSAFVGNGIYKSVDGGVTFSHLPSTMPLSENNLNDDWAFVNEIAIHPSDGNFVIAATHGGLKFSGDGGVTWQEATLSGSNLRAEDATVTSAGVAFACVGDKLFRSEDGINYSLVHNVGGFPSASNISRIEIAVAPSDPNYIYVLIANDDHELHGVYRSIDGGLNWETLAVNSGLFNPLGSQGEYDMAIAVYPNNKNRLLLGGQLHLWSWAETAGWYLLSEWTNASPTNPFYVHADQHAIVFNPQNPNTVFIATDGGVFVSYNADQQFPSFSAKNKGLNITQFYGMSAATSGEVLGGSQDNGTQLIDFNGNSPQNAVNVKGGDGGKSILSRNRPGTMFAEYIFGSVERSGAFDLGFSGFFDSNIDCEPSYWLEIDSEQVLICLPDGYPDDGALFIAPMALYEGPQSEDHEGLFFLGCRGAVWVGTKALRMFKAPQWFPINIPGSSDVSALASAENGLLFVGTNNGNLYRIDGLIQVLYDSIAAGTTLLSDSVSRTLIANNSTWIGGGARYITGIAVDPNHPEHVVVTLGNYSNGSHYEYVYQSFNAQTATGVVAANFQSIQGDLPQMPVYDAEIEFNNNNIILLGTEHGVWASDDQGVNWFPQNTGLAAVPVFEVTRQYLHNSNCQVYYIATYGRGMFRTTSLTQFGCDTHIGLGTNEPAAIGQLSEINLFPNPASSFVNICFISDAKVGVDIKFISMNGNAMKHITGFTSQTGLNQIGLNIKELPTGVYIIQINSENDVLGKRLVVAR